MSDRIRTQSAVLIDLYQHGGEQLGIEAFTWGVLGNPQWEFAAQVVVLVGLVAVWTRRYTRYDEARVAKALLGGNENIGIEIERSE